MIPIPFRIPSMEVSCWNCLRATRICEVMVNVSHLVRRNVKNNFGEASDSVYRIAYSFEGR